MVRTLFAALLACTLAGCEAPPKKETAPGRAGAAAPSSQPARGSTAAPSAHVGGRSAIVRDLLIEENALSYVQPQDRADVDARKAALASEFSERFRGELVKRGYFESLVAEGASANAVVVQPKALVMDPGVKTGVLTGTATRIDIMVVISDATTGEQIAAYTVPTQFLPRTSLPPAERLRVYLPAASRLAAERMALLR